MIKPKECMQNVPSIGKICVVCPKLQQLQQVKGEPGGRLCWMFSLGNNDIHLLFLSNEFVK